MAFPGLEAGEELGRETRLGERADLLAADGSPLGRGPCLGSHLPARSIGARDRRRDGVAVTKAGHRAVRARVPQGHAGRDISGLELAFNERLAGQPSGELFATGEEGQKRTLATGEPTHGEDVKTTIDPEVQTAAVTALGDQYGGVAVLDAKTGDVRGVAGLAFSAPQPPGSTFKIITATAGLDAGVVELGRRVSRSRPRTPTIGREISNAHDAPCGGTFVQSFANSCNTVFAPLGVEVGTEKMVETARGVRLRLASRRWRAEDELEALAPPPSSLGEIDSDVALGESSIGQGQVLATPLADGFGRPDDRERRRAPPDLDREERGAAARRRSRSRSTSPETAQKVEGMMLEVVRSGTGTAAQIPGIQVAGKTGTAELGPAGARAGAGPGAGRGSAAGGERVVRLLRAGRQAGARDRGDAHQHSPAAAARSRRRSRARSTRIGA